MTTPAIKHSQRILLAEDNDNDAELMLRALAQNDMARFVDHVRDGVEALDYLFCRGRFSDRPNTNPLFVLLDIKMPRVDGLEVLREIRLDPRLRLVPVVLLTASSEDQDLIRSYQLGVNAYVVKPVDAAAFARTVEELGAFWSVKNLQPPAGAIASE